MSQVLRFLPEAAHEVTEAHLWYESQRVGLGDEFLVQLDHSLIEIQDRPLIFPVITRVIRRAVLKRFPYCIYFVVREHVIVVLAVLHGSRRPGIWQRRKLQ